MSDHVLVNVHEAKTHLSRLLERVSQGEEIIISKAGTPVAKLVPFTGSREPRKPGGWEGKVWMADDFDDLPPEIEETFYRDEP